MTIAAADPETPQATTGDTPAVVRQFLESLLDRYRTWCEMNDRHVPDRATLDDRLLSLELAEAALRLAAAQHRPPQVAVMGPTQTGKSTVVNLLLGSQAAEVSPLAGFTVHAHGFTCDAAADDAWTAPLFPGWPRKDDADLSRDALDGYSLTPVPATTLPPCVVWDTPDFDSLAAHAYRRGVLEIAAMADVIVLVLSKEKYSDLAVWRMLRLIRPLGRTIVMVLNKMSDDAREPIIASLRQRLRELDAAAADLPIVTLPYRSDLKNPEALSGTIEGDALRDAVRNAASACVASETQRRRTSQRRAGVATLIRAHWPSWTAPIAAERDARQQWDTCVRIAVADAVAFYRRDYLEHPQRYDSFRRATVELLQLLELPGIGGVLGSVRQVVTWPARQLWAAGKTLLRPRGSLAHHAGAEEVVTSDLVERVLTGLERDAIRRADASTPDAVVWRALADRLARDGAVLRERFRTASAAAREQFAPQIHAAASQLYDLLKTRPALLNSLRAARATGDAASIVLAIKTGGMHVNDLLLAPAMFAVMSLVTEGALGTYMHSVADDLKRKQLAHIRASFFDGVLSRELHELARGLDDKRLFGLDAVDADVALKALSEWGSRGDA